MENKNCYQCKNEISPDQKYCSQCGSKQFAINEFRGLTISLFWVVMIFISGWMIAIFADDGFEWGIVALFVPIYILMAIIYLIFKRTYDEL